MKHRARALFAHFSPLFLLCVVLPTALAIVYYGLVASDVYTSESRFVVRSPQRQGSSPLGSLLQGAGFGRAADDNYTVQDYILSRDALRVLDAQLKVGRAYGDGSVDPISRFAGLWPDDSFEALHRYYRTMVSVQIDSTSSIATLTVRAFTAQDAGAINRLLLAQGEELVNRLNERGRQDMIRFATTEVMQASESARDAAVILSNYRGAEGVVDPERQATVQLQQIAKLQDELIATATQLAQLKALTPLNPQIAALENRASTLRTAIGAESGKVTGGNGSLTRKAPMYQRLVLDAEFANRQLASALTGLETARNEARRQQVYLERIAQPSVPDVAQEPRRVRGVLATFALGLVAWGILALLIAGIREHQQ
jgi:capsular polysaccharide transport system permease protein